MWNRPGPWLPGPKIGGIEVVRGYAEALPILTASFDFALMVTVLCFLADPMPALQEATRILKPQGRLIIGMIDPDSPLGRSYEANKDKSKFYRQARFLPIPQVLKWLAELGYKNPEIRQTVFQSLPDNTAPELLGKGTAPALSSSSPPGNRLYKPESSEPRAEQHGRFKNILTAQN